jgi:hypothetical protein
VLSLLLQNVAENMNVCGKKWLTACDHNVLEPMLDDFFNQAADSSVYASRFPRRKRGIAPGAS